MQNNYINYKTLLQKKFSAYDWTMSDPEDYDTLVWNQVGVDKPSKEFLDMKLTSARNNYANNRQKMYPHIVEQLDMIWHAIDNGALDKTSLFYTSIKDIKDSFPKP